MQIIPGDIAMRAVVSATGTGINGAIGYLSIWSLTNLNPLLGVATSILGELIEPYFDCLLFGKASLGTSFKKNEMIAQSQNAASDSSFNLKSIAWISIIIQTTVVSALVLKSFGEAVSIQNLLKIGGSLAAGRFLILFWLSEPEKEKKEPLDKIKSKASQIVSKASNVLTSKKK